MKAAITKQFRIIGILFLTIFCGYLLLTLVYLLPNSLLADNVKKSATELLQQGVYPSIYFKGAVLDNWTDAECISVTYNTSSSNPFYNAINAFHMGETDGVQRLYDTLFHPDAVLNSVDHSYLWHGFRIWLRPLLCLYELSDIRALCFCINFVLFGVLCVFLQKLPGHLWNVLPFAAAYFYFNFAVESISLLFFTDLNIMMLSCLGILWAVSRKKDPTIIFALTGAVIAFSSMLIFPMLAIGFPLIVWLTATKDVKRSLIEKILHMIPYALYWLIGYAITSLTKILLSQTMINSNSGVNMVKLYLGSSNHLSAADRMERLRKVFNQIIYTSDLRYDCLMLSIAILLLIIIIRRKFSRHALLQGIPYLAIALLPFLWIFAVAGHSHHFWTCFNFSIMIYAVLQLLCNMCHHKEGGA